MTYKIITIDGPSGVGKGTVATMIADELGLNYLDSGSLYRALALKLFELNHNFEEVINNLDYLISDINIDELIDFHKSHNSLGTVTAVRPPSRFGELNIDNKNNVIGLEEKPQMGQGLINGGFFVFDKELFSYLDDSSSCDFEFGPLQEITKDRQLKAFHHSGFWQCMDNVRERDYLNELIKQNLAPWIIW